MSGPILLFGASGFVGRNLTDRLAADGRDVIAISQSGAAVPGAKRALSIDALDSLRDLPADTIAVHVANYRYDSTRFDLAQSDILLNNQMLNARVLHFCADRGIKELRLASSVAVYPDGQPLDDAQPIDLNAPPIASEAFYAWSKRFAEIAAGVYAQRFGLNSVIFRLSNPYGPYDSTNPAKAHVAPAFVMKALDSNPVFPIRGDPSVERDFIYVGDVVEAFVRTLDWRGRSETYNLCTGRTDTLLTLAQTVMRMAGVDKPIEAGAPGAFGPQARRSTADRIRAALGLHFVSLEDGMAPTVAWYRREFRG